MNSELPLVTPEWLSSPKVRAVCSTRLGGFSQPPWDSLNLGDHVADDQADVDANRDLLAKTVSLDAGRIGWLSQVHGTEVVELGAGFSGARPEADASFTRVPGVACAILTADCLPVILCDRSGSVVGAAHAGWRSLAGGVLENLIDSMGVPAQNLIAWLGPAIGPDAFEVGPEVREVFLEYDSGAVQAFTPSEHRSGHYLADIYALARQRLGRAGVTAISGGGFCTVHDSSRFFSYRRDGQTGRMATLVWLTS
ncbi:peptidoglycan editing factor PgeF [Marinobacter salinexigens]|uniref:Purine nucleoside phosphorylase n=1 Tax=Marinobacter salinexigens TaxID=2919747 RepID=A0A5B0VC98_9GAMM|nr:peptidoglycan editing factor PgeF [Marinobacter salinexigens]KAA1171699.1 peptidoglycan editing factor PgeF [Marinobacter salinexigens]